VRLAELRGRVALVSFVYTRCLTACPLLLRDEPSRLTPVLHAWDEWTRRGGDGELDHPARVYLLDRAGRVREIYALEFFDQRQAWLDVRALLRER
jgi:cytochrome oxidase Cu insertion factor (SCO1/SenC/PrrC family)